MRSPARFPDSAVEDVPQELLELGKRIAALPAEQFHELQGSYTQVVECVRRRRRILGLVQDALAQLRLDIKYLMFDLEVTREERDELRSQLDEIQRDDPSSGW